MKTPQIPKRTIQSRYSLSLTALSLALVSLGGCGGGSSGGGGSGGGITIDTLPPTLQSPSSSLAIDNDKKTLSVKLSENISPSSLVKDRISVFKDGSDTPLSIDSVSSSGNIITITLANPISSAGKYYVKFEKWAFSDISGNRNEPLTTELDTITGEGGGNENNPPSETPSIALVGGGSLTNDNTPSISVSGGVEGYTVNIY